MSKKIIWLLAIISSVSLGSILLLADEFDEAEVVHASKRDIKVEVKSEKEAIKAAKEKLNAQNLLRSEINFLSYDGEQEKLVQLGNEKGNESKVTQGQKYIIQIVNHNAVDLYLYAFRIVGKKVIRLFPKEGEESIVYADTDKSISGDEVVQFKSFSKGRIILYFFLSKKKWKKLESKMTIKKLLTMYKSFAKSDLYVAKLNNKKTVDQFEEEGFNPYNVWFKNKMVRKVVLLRRKK